MTATKSNELLTQEITYVKERLEAIEKKLDEKYVSHESFDLVVKSLQEAIRLQDRKSNSIINGALILATPIYGAVITLLFKIFAS